MRAWNWIRSNHFEEKPHRTWKTENSFRRMKNDTDFELELVRFSSRKGSRREGS